MSTVLTFNEIMESDVNDLSFERQQSEITLIQDEMTLSTDDNINETTLEAQENLHRPDELESSSITDSSTSSTNDSLNGTKSTKKSVLFDTVTVYHFTRSQGFNSIPSQGGSTLGMKRRHFLRRKLSVDLFEEVRRRSRREILLKIRYDKTRPKRSHDSNEPHYSSVSSTASSSSSSVTSSTSSTTSSSSSSLSSTSNANTSSDSDDETFSDFSDISDSELENDSYIFVQPIGVKLRRSLLRESGVQRIDPSEKWECKTIRDSRDRSGCSCANQCIPGLCECIMLGVNCHVDRTSYPCGCISEGCQNPLGRTEFDVKKVKGHLTDTLYKAGIG